MLPYLGQDQISVEVAEQCNVVLVMNLYFPEKASKSVNETDTVLMSISCCNQDSWLVNESQNGSLIKYSNAFCFDKSDFFSFDQICNFSALVYKGELL